MIVFIRIETTKANSAYIYIQSLNYLYQFRNRMTNSLLCSLETVKARIISIWMKQFHEQIREFPDISQ